MIIIVLLFHIYLLLHTGFTAWPEIFSYPYLFDKGFLLYKDIAHVYQPLLTLILFVIFKLFGYKLLVLKIFTWGIIVLNDILIYRLLKSYILNHRSALAAVFIYSLIQVFFEGNMLWFDLAATPLILLLLIASLNTNYLLIGFFLALCVLVKQQTVLLTFPVLFILVKNRGSWLKVLLGGLIPTLLVLVWIYTTGAFKDYIFWALTFPTQWLPKFASYPALPTINQWLVIVLLSIPLLKSNWTFRLFFLALLTAAFPRFSYFHLQPALVIYAVILGHLLIHRYLRIWLLILSVGTAALLIKPQYIQDRFWDVAQAKELQKLVKPNEKVFLLGPHSLLYVLANRIPPRPWIDNYVWHFEIDGMQKLQIEAWEKDPPIYILRTKPMPGAWDALGVYQPQVIIKYMEMNYNNTGLISNNVEVWQRK